MAIARDANTGVAPANALSFTQAYTCTGANLFLVVWIDVTNASDIITGVTYNGVAMTQTLKRQKAFAGTGWCYGYTLAAPATGTHNVVISGSTTITGAVFYITSYTGSVQSSIPDSSNQNGIATSTTFTLTTTIVAANSWLLGFSIDNSGGATAGAGTSKTSALDPARGEQTWDSNGPLASGSRSLNMANGSSNWDGLIISIAPIPPFIAAQQKPVSQAVNRSATY